MERDHSMEYVIPHHPAHSTGPFDDGKPLSSLDSANRGNDSVVQQSFHQIVNGAVGSGVLDIISKDVPRAPERLNESFVIGALRLLLRRWSFLTGHSTATL
jgi:hypothetical protein